MSIQSNWEQYRSQVIHEDAPQYMVECLYRSFLAGAVCTASDFAQAIDEGPAAVMALMTSIADTGFDEIATVQEELAQEAEQN